VETKNTPFGVPLQNLTYKFFCPFIFCIVENIFWRPFFNYHSIVHKNDSIPYFPRKHKAKLKNRFGSNESIRFEIPPAYEEAKGEEEEGSFEIVKTKRFPIKPMSPEEAILQMNLLGHNFFVFTNADTDTINVVYKRKDGKYGLIEPLE